MLLLADGRTLCRVVVAGVPVSHPGINKCALTLQDPDVRRADSGPGVCGRAVVKVSVGRLAITNYAEVKCLPHTAGPQSLYHAPDSHHLTPVLGGAQVSPRKVRGGVGRLKIAIHKGLFLRKTVAPLTNRVCVGHGPDFMGAVNSPASSKSDLPVGYHMRWPTKKDRPSG